MFEIKNLKISFETDNGAFLAVDDLSLRINEGEIMGLAGESGCGKSTAALSILRLIPSPPGRIEAGAIYFNKTDILSVDIKKMRKIRGSEISMIFQEPGSALSPLHRIGSQLVEAVLARRKMPKTRAWRMAETWLEKVGIPGHKESMFAYPHQLSGGMKQRVMIAMAMMTNPGLVIADEPTTALDATIQAQIFDLMLKMRARRRTSMLLISHNMGAIREMCRRTAIMYASRIVESGEVGDIFSAPAHPYTQALIKSVPPLSLKPGRLNSIPGRPPSPFNHPAGCNFHNRCPYVSVKCRKKRPPFFDLGNGHKAACFLVEK